MAIAERAEGAADGEPHISPKTAKPVVEEPEDAGGDGKGAVSESSGFFIGAAAGEEIETSHSATEPSAAYAQDTSRPQQMTNTAHGISLPWRFRKQDGQCLSAGL